MLGLTSRYHGPSTITAWSSGTGFAGGCVCVCVADFEDETCGCVVMCRVRRGGLEGRQQKEMSRSLRGCC